jgi:hypothetical protein
VTYGLLVCVAKPNFDCEDGNCIFYYAGGNKSDGVPGAGFFLEVIASVMFLLGSVLDSMQHICHTRCTMQHTSCTMYYCYTNTVLLLY